MKRENSNGMILCTGLLDRICIWDLFLLNRGLIILIELMHILVKYVYAFIDVELIGFSQVAMNIISLTAVFIVIGYFIYWFDRIKISE